MALIGPRRRLVQWGLGLLLFLLPFARLDGESLFRIDLPSLSLHFFGSRLPIEDLYLLGLLLFSLLFLLLLVTLVLGRAWCGWLCPQTALADLAEFLARTCGLRVSPQAIDGGVGQRILLSGVFLLFSLLGGAVFVWYFLGPYEYFARLIDGRLGGWPLGSTLGLALFLWLDFSLIRRLACRDFCPYGRFQTVLTDSCTLSLGVDPAEAGRCLNCLACVRACPMGIDIRRGFQIECINCARCLDACRKIMLPRGQSGLIRYRFGTGERGLRRLLSPRLLLVSLLFLLASSALIFALCNRPEAGLTVVRNATTRKSLAQEQGHPVFFTAFLTNKAQSSRGYRLEARLVSGTPVALKGQVEKIDLGPGEKRRLVLVALLSPGQAATGLALDFFALEQKSGLEKARAKALIPPNP